MSKKSLKNTLLIIVVILILGFIGYTAWYSYFREQPEEQEVALNEEQKEEEEKIIYENEDYGFGIELPSAWEDYKTTQGIVPEDSNMSDIINFGIDPQDLMFNINVHTEEQWNKILAEDGPFQPTYIGENVGWTFSYNTAQDTVNDEMAERMREVEDIIYTFSVTAAPKKEVPVKTEKPSEKEDASSWSTYTDSKNGYSFKYPSDWFVLETQDEGVVVTNFKYPMEIGRELSKDETKITVNVIENASNMSAKEWVDAIEYNKKNIKKQSDIKVAGVNALKIEAEDLGPHVDIYFPKDGKMFEVVNFSNSEKLDQILSTFDAD